MLGEWFSGWFGEWFGSEDSGEFVYAAVSFGGTSTFTCNAVAQAIIPPTPIATGEMVGGYTRKRRSSAPKYIKQKEVSFSWSGIESSFEIQAKNAVYTDFQLEAYASFHVGATLQFSSSAILHGSSDLTISAASQRKATGKSNKKKLGVTVEAVEIDLLEEEELLLLLAL